ncbi:MAG: hypothetical protein E7Z91_07120 [Cyanobacteria bacterium SIG30]|nr:hypothetical protein [Cyanobacteria bacterium SIG30]
MAASQARYLALTARKSNVEFQGQQINQQRTLLSVEQTELFNELITLETPTPPSVADYTQSVYSFTTTDSAGNNTVYKILSDSITETEEVDAENNKIYSMDIIWTIDGVDYTSTVEGLLEKKEGANLYSYFKITDAGTTGIQTQDALPLSSGSWEDEQAYTDAMNKYNRDQSVYTKKVEEINAKTREIQIQDRTLEMKLRNLDTEQNAIQTELESVKKVIQDTIETVFKTFQS